MLSYTMSKNLVPQSKPSSMFFIFILMTHFSKVMIIFFFNFWKWNIVYKILLITGWPGLYVDLADSASYIFYSILALFTSKTGGLYPLYFHFPTYVCEFRVLKFTYMWGVRRRIQKKVNTKT